MVTFTLENITERFISLHYPSFHNSYNFTLDNILRNFNEFKPTIIN